MVEQPKVLYSLMISACLVSFFIMQAIDSRDRHDVLRRQQPTMEPTMCNCDPGPPGSPGRRGKRG